jgi:hypothetical protein
MSLGSQDGDKGIYCRQDVVAQVDNKPKWLRGEVIHHLLIFLSILQPEHIQNTIITFLKEVR